MAPNPLSTESILSHMAAAIPTHPKDDTGCDFSSSYEALALFSHACMAAVGFRLVGFKEDQMKEEECEKLAPRLAPEWNSSFGSHAFVYAHSQSSMQYVIKVDRLGGKAEIRGIGLGDEKITRMEITAKDYISSAALPLRITITESGEEDRSDLEKKLKQVFISPSRIQDLADLFKTEIIQKLIPKLHKEGYEEAAHVHQEGEDSRARPPPDLLAQPLPESARPNPYGIPHGQDFPRPFPQGDFPPPGFDDELDMNRGPRRGFPGGPSPFGIGDRDLNPPDLGPHDPLRRSFVPGYGGGMGMGGGMHPTFDDPLFAGRGGQGGFPGAGNAPPGARYDPTGPGGAPRGSGQGRDPFDNFVDYHGPPHMGGGNGPGFGGSRFNGPGFGGSGFGGDII
ncbi:hypothetical protein HYALB_00001611 [Hymenoscyphus albidus]|uniref:Proteasome inhibitor PI31 subunit n=1 Tax=Hymenoscyphus albidus TaxID=595503 RepID=A0A9N9LAY1_9HELO|nr:hypothetical protein HYALB_00001611 [Hymenoscyphus albidus]